MGGIGISFGICFTILFSIPSAMGFFVAALLRNDGKNSVNAPA
jgi:hypothetical protein